jgi:hypothetical protein
LSVVFIFGTIPIAEALERREQVVTDADDVPLEWIGIDRPYTEADVRSMDEALALPDVVSV